MAPFAERVSTLARIAATERQAKLVSALAACDLDQNPNMAMLVLLATSTPVNPLPDSASDLFWHGRFYFGRVGGRGVVPMFAKFDFADWNGKCSSKLLFVVRAPALLCRSVDS